MIEAAEVETVAADTNDRRTPRWFFEQCEARFGVFTLDVAATVENTLCGRWLGPGSFWGKDGLLAPWILNGRPETAWGNVPYGPPGTIERWIAKARFERDGNGTRTLMLLPADTSTKWYHDVSRTELFELVPFRLKFDGPEGVQQNTAKFGSVLVWIAPQITRKTQGR